MAFFTCPNCKITLKKGFWEIIDQCPECHVAWPVDPDAPKRIERRIFISTYVFTLLSFVPILGFIFGLIATFWGYLAVKIINKAFLGAAAMLIGVIVGVLGQAMLTWWAVGWTMDRLCTRRLTTLANSIYAYKSLSGQYPPDLQAMSDMRLPVPASCPVGGGEYFYFCPTASTQPTTPQASITPATMGVRQTTTRRTLQPTNQPTTQPATEPAVATFGDSRTLLVAEVLSAHRWAHMCITTDADVRAFPHKEFKRLLEEPQNLEFAEAFHKAWEAATQPATAPASSQPAMPTSSPAINIDQDQPTAEPGLEPD